VKEMRETEKEKRKLKNTKKERQEGGNIDRRKEKGGIRRDKEGETERMRKRSRRI